MQKDNHYLKIIWKVCIPEWLEVDTNIRLAMDGSITGSNKASNEDWTYSFTHSFRPIHSLITDELGNTIKAKDLRKNSEKLRSSLKFKYESNPWLLEKYESFDQFYDKFFSNLFVKHIDHLIADIS